MDWVPRSESGRRVDDSEESVRVVVEVAGLMKVFEDSFKDLVVGSVFEEVGGDWVELCLREGTRK